MKTILIAAALMAGTAAVAQPTTGQPPNQPDVSQPGQSDAPEATQPPTSQQPMDQPSGMPSPPPGNTQTTTSAWGNNPSAGSMQSRPATGTYPRCTRQLRDNCVQRGPR